MPVTGFQLSDELRKKTGRFQKIDPVMQRIGLEVILPALGRNYTGAGLKQRTGTAYRALTQRGAVGNLFVVRDNQIEVGVTQALWNKYLKYPIEGHTKTVIRALRRGGRLRIQFSDGTVIYRRSVKGTKPHPLAAPSNWTPTFEDGQKITKILVEEMSK